MSSRRLSRTIPLLETAVVLLTSCGETPPWAAPSCPPAGDSGGVILVAQAVPSATFVPCVKEFPVGWDFGGQVVETGRAEFWLNSDRAGERAVTVMLTESCDTSNAVEVPTEADEVGIRRYESPRSLPPRFAGDRYYVFPGGCITYRFAFQRAASFEEVVEATEALSFASREEGAEALRREGFILCGAGVDCP